MHKLKFLYHTSCANACLRPTLIELGFRKTKFTQTIVNRANKTLFIVSWTSGFLDAMQSQQKIAEDWDFAPTAVN